MWLRWFLCMAGQVNIFFTCTVLYGVEWVNIFFTCTVLHAVEQIIIFFRCTELHDRTGKYFFHVLYCMVEQVNILYMYCTAQQSRYIFFTCTLLNGGSGTIYSLHVGFPVVITLRVTLSFTYAGALRVITRLLRLRKKVQFRVINA